MVETPLKHATVADGVGEPAEAVGLSAPMNRKQLEEKLAEERIRPEAYSLSGGYHPYRYVLAEESDGRWSTYYCERGQRLSLAYFPSEEAACNHLLAHVLKEPTTRSCP